MKLELDVYEVECLSRLIEDELYELIKIFKGMEEGDLLYNGVKTEIERLNGIRKKLKQ